MSNTEDDLRELLATATSWPVYSRQFPPDLPESYCIQQIGGETNTSNIRRAVHFISVMACAKRLEDAREHLNHARNFLVMNIPTHDDGNGHQVATVLNGTHYYLAEAMEQGRILAKTARGPSYIESVTLRVVRQL